MLDSALIFLTLDNFEMIPPFGRLIEIIALSLNLGDRSWISILHWKVGQDQIVITWYLLFTNSLLEIFSFFFFLLEIQLWCCVLVMLNAAFDVPTLLSFLHWHFVTFLFSTSFEVLVEFAVIHAPITLTLLAPLVTTTFSSFLNKSPTHIILNSISQINWRISKGHTWDDSMWSAEKFCHTKKWLKKKKILFVYLLRFWEVGYAENFIVTYYKQTNGRLLSFFFFLISVCFY